MAKEKPAARGFAIESHWRGRQRTQIPQARPGQAVLKSV